MFPLDHVVGNGCILAGDQFCGAIAKHLAAAKRDIILDNGSLTFVLDNDQIPGMNHARLIGACGHEQEMDGSL